MEDGQIAARRVPIAAWRWSWRLLPPLEVSRVAARASIAARVSGLLWVGHGIVSTMIAVVHGKGVGTLGSHGARPIAACGFCGDAVMKSLLLE